MDEVFKRARTQTRDVYRRKAAAWDRDRPRTLLERAWLDRMIASIAPGGRVLDLGCGAGAPLTAYFLERAFHVTGLDYAPAMLSIARARYRDAHWIAGDIRMLPINAAFDGVISWDGFFHLDQAEQRIALPEIAGRVADDGTLMLTVGPAEGEVIGSVDGESVFHASLSPSEYETLLRRAGFGEITFSPNDETVGGRSILFAKR